MPSINDTVMRAALELAIEETEKLDELPGMVVAASREIGEAALHYWKTQAGMMLNTTRERYQNTLYLDDSTPNEIRVRMRDDDQLIIDIEDGKQPFDLKPGFLRGQPARVIPINPPRDMRTVTSGTDPSKWMHPGFTALNLVEETERYIEDELVPNKLDEMFGDL